MNLRRVFAQGCSKERVCISGLRPEEAARGRVPAEDGRVVRVCALHRQPSQGAFLSTQRIIPHVEHVLVSYTPQRRTRVPKSFFIAPPPLSGVGGGGFHRMLKDIKKSTCATVNIN